MRRRHCVKNSFEDNQVALRKLLLTICNLKSHLTLSRHKKRSALNETKHLKRVGALITSYSDIYTDTISWEIKYIIKLDVGIRNCAKAIA